MDLRSIPRYPRISRTLVYAIRCMSWATSRVSPAFFAGAWTVRNLWMSSGETLGLLGCAGRALAGRFPWNPPFATVLPLGSVPLGRPLRTLARRPRYRRGWLLLGALGGDRSASLRMAEIPQ
jgi:hypothetical protein